MTTSDLPLWHNTDPETSAVAACVTNANALRNLLAEELERCGLDGMTGDEASAWVEEAFPDRYVEYAGRRRLSDLLDPGFCNGTAIALPTANRRMNRRGNMERVVIHQGAI